MIADDPKIVKKVFLVKVVTGCEYNWRENHVEEQIRVEFDFCLKTLLIRMSDYIFQYDSRYYAHEYRNDWFMKKSDFLHVYQMRGQYVDDEYEDYDDRLELENLHHYLIRKKNVLRYDTN